jgi:DNA-binding response OmpR family regulator
MKIILVVDDEPIVIYVLKKYLTKKGYQVHTATNGNDAVGKAKELRPHIVLLDIALPDMSGLDVLREIKKIDPNISVIMVTGVFEEKIAINAMQFGACDYVTKPFHYDYLETAVSVKIAMVLDATGRT